MHTSLEQHVAILGSVHLSLVSGCQEAELSGVISGAVNSEIRACKRVVAVDVILNLRGRLAAVCAELPDLLQQGR